ncbi:conserved protein, unknown function, partial [Hepatocystis sp. ex Piliocolobus tephrosceles]
NNGILANLLENFSYETEDKTVTSNVRNATLTTPEQKTNNVINNNNINTNSKGVRNARRRPTYSPAARNLILETEEELDDDDKMSTDDLGDDISAMDLKKAKIKEYKNALTKVVKIKTAIFYETVTVTCSMDGQYLEWYKGSVSDEKKKKSIGSLPIDKITSIRTKVDNIKSLEITVNSTNISTYLFIFKTREEREEWQNNLESFKKIICMK